jgi:hypothetical protein
VILARFEEDAVAGPDDRGGAALAPAQTDALGDVDVLAESVGVPRRAGTGRKWTIAAPTREGGAGVATVSMKTYR